MIVIDFENRLDDLMYDINVEIQGLDPEVSEDEINQLEMIKKELNEVHSSLLKFKRMTLKRINHAS